MNAITSAQALVAFYARLKYACFTTAHKSGKIADLSKGTGDKSVLVTHRFLPWNP
jgi:hypothetical protein